MEENIINILLSQHIGIKNHLSEIKEETEKNQPLAETVFNGLTEFKNLLAQHLDLENNVFYPQLLEKMEKRGIDIKETVKFIEAMKSIEKKIENFMKKYASVENIRNNIRNFKIDLSNISSILILRMTNEETEVFHSFPLFNES